VVETGDEKVKFTAIQGILVKGILWLQKSNDHFKYMGLSNLLDYILAENQVLERHVYISVEDYIKEDYTVFRKELDMIDAFYFNLFKKIGQRHQVNVDLIEEIVLELLPE
jgi:hypothetical protein